MPNAVLHLVATVSTAVVPLGILGAGCQLGLPSSLLPEVLTALLAWTLLSVPIAMLVGHCMLGDD